MYLPYAQVLHGRSLVWTMSEIDDGLETGEWKPSAFLRYESFKKVVGPLTASLLSGRGFQRYISWNIQMNAVANLEQKRHEVAPKAINHLFKYFLTCVSCRKLPP
jgi:hypothetical protein